MPLDAALVAFDDSQGGLPRMIKRLRISKLACRNLQLVKIRHSCSRFAEDDC